MKKLRIFSLLAILVFTVAALGHGTKSAPTPRAPQAQQSPQPPPTIASSVDREISAVEKQFVDDREHAAHTGAQQIDPFASGYIWRRPRL
jgi:hypothetical protein